MKNRVYIDAGPIAENNRSGVGHVAYHTLKAILSKKEFMKNHEVFLVVPFNKIHLLEKDLLEKCRIKKIYLPGRLVNGLTRFNMLPPMDIFFGKGIYIFFNFKNWPLSFSKSVTYVHDMYFKIAPENIEPRNLDLLNRNLSTYVQRSDVVVAVSEYTKKDIQKFYPFTQSKVEVIYNGIDTAVYYPRTQKEQRAVCGKYGLSPGEYFMFLSNIEPRKNILPLLDAYKLYVDQYDKRVALLLIGGMGWNNADILDKIERLKKDGYKVIKPAQYVPDEDLPTLLSAAIGLVHPAIYEGFGMTILEALACGTDVIIGNNSSIPEVVGVGYRSYVDVDSPTSIASRMKEVAYRKQRNKSLDRSLKDRPLMFSWNKAAQELIGVVDKLEV